MSVVVPVRDGVDLLAQQVARLQEQAYDGPLEFVVADNGSRDGVPDLIRRRRLTDPRLRLVDASARPGPAAARNIGAAVATGTLLLFCDADDLVEPGWVQALVGALAGADGVAGYLDFTSLNGGLQRPPRDPTPHQFRYLPAGLGANLAVRAAVFRRLGGFDETLLAGEDIDLCWRLQSAGHRFACAPAAVVAKRERGGTRARARQAITYGRCDPALFRRHHAQGMPRNLLLALKTWAWLVLNIPLLGDGRRRRTWLHAFGLRIGRLLGSLRNGVVYP